VKLKLQIITIYDYGVIILILFRKLLLIVFQQLFDTIDSGIEEILIITSKSKRAIEDHIDRNVEFELELEKKTNEELLKVLRDITDPVGINYIIQKEAKGLRHAIYCAKTLLLTSHLLLSLVMM